MPLQIKTSSTFSTFRKKLKEFLQNWIPSSSKFTTRIKSNLRKQNEDNSTGYHANTTTYCVSIAELLFSVLLGLKVFVAQVGGAALFSNLAHVAIFVFICPARKKCLPRIKIYLRLIKLPEQSTYSINTLKINNSLNWTFPSVSIAMKYIGILQLICCTRSSARSGFEPKLRQRQGWRCVVVSTCTNYLNGLLFKSRLGSTNYKVYKPLLSVTRMIMLNGRPVSVGTLHVIGTLRT